MFTSTIVLVPPEGQRGKVIIECPIDSMVFASVCSALGDFGWMIGESIPVDLNPDLTREEWEREPPAHRPAQPTPET